MIEKSGTGMTTVMVVVWLNEPDVPVTFTRYVPGSVELLAVMVSCACPEPVKLVWFRNGVSPDEVDADSVTDPLKPFTDPIVMTEIRLVPTKMVSDEGLAESVKSDTWIVTIAV